MRNNIIKRRLEYSMLGGILFNFISLFIPIINLTLTSETKQYTEGYSVGSLIKFLVPAVLNGDKGELSNPPLSLMAFLLFGLICWIASLFTLVLVFQSMRARKVNIFRTIAVSIFELLTALFFLVFSAQMKTFAIKVAVEPYFGNIRTGFNFLGLVPILVVIVFSFVNIYMLLVIIKRGEEYDEIDEENALLCPMIDARRMEAYTTIYNRALKEVRTVQADIIDEHTYDEWLNKGVVYFFGNGAEKCQTVIQHANAKFVSHIVPQARYMGEIAEKRPILDIKQMAYYEPFYLKEFVATVAKNKVF